ncbi:receptor kinase-like protein Xa21 [Hibiscus syriacus]|uniref:receptor kinase-like protein Xa21 n=1 Tax=Hibiscus syriacus TaxID=106335 RepID=UPI00192161B9|nr:receptor kinase-like protein Xa21 [Hibiscus syriacus]
MSFLSSLTNCRGLEALDIGGNTVIGSKLPGLVGNLSGSLWEFSAYGCNIRGGIPSEIGNLSNLINIELAGNELTGMIPATFGALKELQSDYLMENMFVGSIPSELSNLAYLNLTSNKLSGPIPSCLGNLSSLRNLLVGSNMFSSSISSTLTRLTDLLILNLSSNSLSGPLPIDIGKWKVLTSMDLSNNRFSGDIPIGVADLKDLTQFSLSNNRLAGSIPTSFGDMLSLKFLDLSRNNLSGEIPKSFDVSFNRLEGEVPEGESFGRYSIESFKGNKALCGAPQLHLPSCKTKPLKSSKAKAKLIIYVAMSIASTILVMALIIIILRSRQRRYKLTTREDLLPLGTWRRISYHELHRATDGFSENNLLGNGSYGSVYKGSLERLNILIDVVSALEYLHHEYGTEGIVSTKGDVYSFGILVMETVTRKKPTAEMFAGERSLKNWVKESISTLYQVVDNNLLSTIGREHAAANNCALSVLQIGLECSAELPDERLDMKESVPKLNKIRAKYLNDTELLRLRHHR